MQKVKSLDEMNRSAANGYIVVIYVMLTHVEIRGILSQIEYSKRLSMPTNVNNCCPKLFCPKLALF